MITAGMEKCIPRQERARRSLPLALERCIPPEELTRHNLQELEKCIPRQGLARHSLSLEHERCTLTMRAVAAYTAGAGELYSTT